MRASGTSTGAPPRFDGAVPPGLSVLGGFEFEFQDDEHNLQEIRVETPDDGRVLVEFKDKQAPPFTWAVDWVVIGPPPKGGDILVPAGER